MVYKYPHQAFLFEAVLGLFSLLVFVTLGKLGWLALALGALRPFVLETSPTKPDDTMYRIYFDAMRIAVFFAGAAISLTIVAIEFGPFTSYNKTIVISIIIPWFMLAHGFIGYYLSKPRRHHHANVG